VSGIFAFAFTVDMLLLFQVYNISGKPRGVVLILSNVDFPGKNYRKNGEKDVELMEELWEDMGCDVHVHQDKTKNVGDFCRSDEQASYLLYSSSWSTDTFL